MSNPANKYLIVIAGPTAVGKTQFAIGIAKKFNAGIISADSRQFYRELNIGTAKPSDEDLAQVEHHFINNLSIHDDYTAGQFEQEVLEFLDGYFQTNDIAIMTGGSGMFIDAVCFGFDDTPRDLNTRKLLNTIFESEGLDPLLLELKQADPVYFEKVDHSNPQRVIRALEVYRSSGKPLSSFFSKKKKERPFKILYIVLDMERNELYDRINQRTDQMIVSGWLNEAESLIQCKDLNALNTVGYKELFLYLEDKYSWEQCIEEIKKSTRNYAKRQITWFKRNEKAKWFNANDEQSVLQFIEKALNENLD